MERKKSITKSTIHEELVKQITLKRANVDSYLSMINDYVALWGFKNELIRDIRKYGAVLKDENTKCRLRNNPSVRELIGINKQMLSLLKELGLSTANVGGDEDDGL